MTSSSPEPEVYVPQPLCPPSSLCGYCTFIRGYLAALTQEDADARE